jgi:hypothetical protein
VRYLVSELSKLTGLESVRKELRLLKTAGLVSFSEQAIEIALSTHAGDELLPHLGSRGGRRMVPVPRKLIRFLARSSKPALVKTVIAYCLRGLNLERSGEVRGAGTVKVSWVCKLCKLSERSTRSARAELIRLGWISKDTGSFQRKLNRDGAYFVIDTAWGRVLNPVAPPRQKNAVRFAPPTEKPETPLDLKNQKLAASEPAGFRETKEGGRRVLVNSPFELRSEKMPCDSDRFSRRVPGRNSPRCRSIGVGSGEPICRLARPTLANVVAADLSSDARLLELYRQAIKLKRVLPGEHARLQFFAAAEHAKNLGQRNPCGLFSAVICRGLWQVISQQDEEGARQRLRNIQEKQGSGRGEVRGGEGRKSFGGCLGKVPLLVRGNSEKSFAAWAKKADKRDKPMLVSTLRRICAVIVIGRKTRFRRSSRRTA